MKLKQVMLFVAAAATCVAALTARLAVAAEDVPALLRIGVSDVTATESLRQDTQKEGRTSHLDRVTQAMDGQLIDRLHNTRKFQVVARSDLDHLQNERNLATSGLVDAKSAAKAFALAGCKYLLVATVDDFQDLSRTEVVEGRDPREVGRRVRLNIVAKIYDTTTGQLLETANVDGGDGDKSEAPAGGDRVSGNELDQLLLAASRKAADKIATRVVDVIFPAKVLAVTGKVATINRGDGTGVVIGGVWEVNEVKGELKDPDTGESLGREEVTIGKVRITAVYPKFSKGEIIEDRGVAAGQVLRFVDDAKSKAPDESGVRQLKPGE